MVKIVARSFLFLAKVMQGIFVKTFIVMLLIEKLRKIIDKYDVFLAQFLITTKFVKLFMRK
jgi:hypothetical protein